MKKLGTKAVAGYWGPTDAMKTFQMSPLPCQSCYARTLQSMIMCPMERERERGEGEMTYDDATFQCIALFYIHAAHLTSHIG